MDFKYCVAASVMGLTLTTQVSATGDADAGKRAFRKCSACHSLDAGENGAGPSLHNIVGSPSAAVTDFRYSDALRSANLIWDTATLTEFLTNPRDAIPGNRMGFRGFRKIEDIENLLAYLVSLETE